MITKTKILVFGQLLQLWHINQVQQPTLDFQLPFAELAEQQPQQEPNQVLLLQTSGQFEATPSIIIAGVNAWFCWQYDCHSVLVPTRTVAYEFCPVIAQDLWRYFSASGMFTADRSNRMDKSLEMRVWLKVNYNELNRCWHLTVDQLCTMSLYHIKQCQNCKFMLVETKLKPKLYNMI